MRYRKLSPSGDYTFGEGSGSFYIDTSQAVAQAVATRLNLYLAEWFLDTTDGTPWYQAVLNVRTKQTRDAILRNRILGTQGVTGIVAYASQVDPNARVFTVQADITTLYGAIKVATTA